jgi:hypothetical protein
MQARTRFVLAYLSLIAIMDLAWEIAQLPLYTIWRTADARHLAFAVVHCTAGDTMIAAASSLIGVLLAGHRAWPLRHCRRAIAFAVVIGVAYTVLSEWLNVEIRQNWAYTAWMPVLPLLGTGLSPVLQWIFVPLAAFQLTRRPSLQPHALGHHGSST